MGVGTGIGAALAEAYGLRSTLSLFGNGIGQRCVAETTGIKKWNHSCAQSDSISVIVVREIL